MVSRAYRRLLAPCLLLSFAGCDRAPENRGQEVNPEKDAVSTGQEARISPPEEKALRAWQEVKPEKDAVSTGQGARISPQEEKALRAWRPMARPLAQSFPEIRILIRHRMSKAEILSFLDSRVRVSATSRADSLYIPVAPSQGFVLRFDSSGRLASVNPGGATPEPWMKASDVEPSRATDAASE